MELYSLEELKDETIGKIGTPERDAYETEVKQAVQNYRIGEAIKLARKQKNLTQTQLAELMGVKKAQLSRVERGSNPTLNTIIRAFNALGIAVSMTCGNMQISLT